MPLEAIKCPGCGSADVTEFKPGSYICSHCESGFKYERPAGATAGPAVCLIDDCGVLAVGRCRTCRRHFCPEHQATAYNPIRGKCAECQRREPEAHVDKVRTCNFCTAVLDAESRCDACQFSACSDHLSTVEGWGRTERRCPDCLQAYNKRHRKT